MDQGFLSLFIAGVAFCGSHVLLSRTRLRGALRDQLGERGFLAFPEERRLLVRAQPDLLPSVGRHALTPEA